MSIGELNAEDLEGLVGRELDGRYLLDKFIDRGGFGAIYRGIDRKFNAPVAVKVGLSYREFMKEAKLAAEVKHDHIVQVSDYGNDKGLAYLVMEFLHGEDLEKLFKRQGNRLTPEQLRKFVNEVGDALASAHDDNLIHRDLKPRNIILKQPTGKSGATVTGAAGKFVLLDFGIAAKLDAKGTQRNRTQDGAGTVEYMAPELLKATPVTTFSSDIYAFGVILYQMMTGRVPFPQSDMSHMALAESVYAITNSPPPPFAQVAPDRSHPKAVEELVLQCLAKDPARRPATMTEVRDRFLAATAPPAAPAESKRPADLGQTLRPAELIDTDEFHLGGRGDTKPHPQFGTPQESSAFWPWMLLGFGVVVAATVFAFGRLKPQPTLQPVAALFINRGMQSEVLQPGETIEVLAGGNVEVTFRLDDLPRDTAVEFAPVDPPASIRIESTGGSPIAASQTFAISIPDLNMPAGTTIPVTLRASIPSQSTGFEKNLQLEVVRPQPWLSDHLKDLGFAEAPDSWLCQVESKLYAAILERRIGGKAVRFRLVPRSIENNVLIRTFYVMERPVSYSLFGEFARQVTEFEVVPRERGARGWENPEAGTEDLPVTEIYVLEAQRFAQWLGGKAGSLPTTEEWELSAGYYDFLRTLQARFARPASEIPSEELRRLSPIRTEIAGTNVNVLMGAGPAENELTEPSGRTWKNCSPYGCLYPLLKTGEWPTEMTATLRQPDVNLRDLCRRGIPTVTDPSLTEHLYEARLRGPAQVRDKVLWLVEDGSEIRIQKKDDLNYPGTLNVLPGISAGGIDLDTGIGFRVVLLTDDEKG